MLRSLFRSVAASNTQIVHGGRDANDTATCVRVKSSNGSTESAGDSNATLAIIIDDDSIGSSDATASSRNSAPYVIRGFTIAPFIIT